MFVSLVNVLKSKKSSLLKQPRSSVLSNLLWQDALGLKWPFSSAGALWPPAICLRLISPLSFMWWRPLLLFRTVLLVWNPVLSYFVSIFSILSKTPLSPHIISMLKDTFLALFFSRQSGVITDKAFLFAHRPAHLVNRKGEHYLWPGHSASCKGLNWTVNL